MVVRAGWRYDSYRHGLASRGIRSKYLSQKTMLVSNTAEPKNSDESIARQELAAKTFQEGIYKNAAQIQKDRDLVAQQKSSQKPMSPKTELQYLSAAEAAERIAVSKEIESRTVNRISDKINRGDLTGSVTLRDGRQVSLVEAIQSLKGGEYNRVVSDLHAQALQLARNGEEIPKELQPFVAKFKNQIKSEESAFKRANESELSKDLKAAAIGTAGAIGAAGEFTGRSAVNVAGYGAQGVAEDINLMQEAKSGPIGQTSGVLNPLLDNSGKTTGMFNSFNSLPGANVKQVKLGKTPNEAVSDEVNELYDARDQMSEVNLKPYDEGIRAFHKGDRESMIKSITALDAEENRLLDNYNLVEQTRAIVLSPRYRAAAYLEDDGFMSFFSSGGKVLAERTRKLNDIKMMIAQRKHEVDTRKGLLKYKLHKMDAIVPPDYSEPGRVDVIQRNKQLSVQIPEQLKPDGYFKTMLGRAEPGE
jgi:hypothetical protein